MGWTWEADHQRQSFPTLPSPLFATQPDYLQNNLEYLVNYNERKKANKTFTSQIAEAHIDTIINARHKRKQKMQWTREGAHNVLQVRAIIASNKWEEKWLDLVLTTLEKVA